MSGHSALAESSSRLVAPHPADHGHGHSPKHVAAKPDRGGRAAWRWAAIIAVTGIAVIAAIVAWPAGSSAPGVDFMRQMDAAALGAPMVAGANYPQIQVERGDGGVTVVAVGVTPRDCVSAGWQMVRKGVLTINGTTPQRVSAAVLTELCYQTDGATIRWAPRRAL